MEIISLHVEGISPLLMHNPAGMRGGEATLGKKAVPSPEEAAEAGCYRLPTGQFFLPAPAFRSCLVRGAAGQRIGKTAATTIVKGSVFCATEHIPLFDGDGAPATTYEIDVRRAVVQRAAVLRARPKLAKWSADVSFEVDTDFITAAMVAEILSVGGRTCGVGDYRPEKSGPFGRFTVAT